MESLDPADWSELRALGHRMVDDMVEHLRAIRSQPAWRAVPPEVRERLRGPVPREGAGEEEAYRAFVEDVLPYPVGNIHPRFWGWVIGTGSPFAALAEMCAAWLNPNVSGLRTAAVHVEEQVLEWMVELMGFPVGSSGILLSGGSMANIVALAVAIRARAPFDVARFGLQAAPRRMVLYASDQTHYSIDKGVRFVGLGTDALRKIPVNDAFQIDIAALTRTIAEDRAAGLHPFCIVANAGTVNTGAFDDLDALADLATHEGLWLHVDGAFGAMCALTADTQHLVRGMARADSLAFDMHKWMYMPIEAACVLVRDADAHRAAFASSAEYLTPLERGTGAESGRFARLGPQLTRGFKALKVWMMLRAHGADLFGQLVARNVAQARALAELVEAAPDLELLAPVASCVVCFRYVVADLDEAALNALNRELLMRLQERGIAVPSHTVLRGRFAIRVANTNHRSRAEDFALLVEKVQEIGAEVLGDGVHVSAGATA
jgi:glutamate/tyrosine decarboxylase-like PLP-dependent enzyme